MDNAHVYFQCDKCFKIYSYICGNFFEEMISFTLISIYLKVQNVVFKITVLKNGEIVTSYNFKN